MDRLPTAVIKKLLFQYVPKDQLPTCKLVCQLWWMTIDEKIGVRVASTINLNDESLKSKSVQDLEDFESKHQMLRTIGISELRIGYVSKHFKLELKYPHLLLKLTLSKKMSASNFDSSLSFVNVKKLTMSVYAISTLKFETMKIELPKLLSLKIFLKKELKVSRGNIPSLIQNCNSFLSHTFPLLEKINLHLYCFMSSYDSEIRNGIFRCLVNHAQSLKIFRCILRFRSRLRSEEIIHELISRQIVQINVPLLLKEFTLAFENVPREELNYFGLQASTWDNLTMNLESLEKYGITCDDSLWLDPVNFNNPWFIRCKPSIPIQLINTNCLTLKKLNLSIQTWIEEDERVKTLDCSIFENCINLEELYLAGQWSHVMTQFFEAFDRRVSYIENVSRLPASLRILKISFVILHDSDILDLMALELDEVHLKCFAGHGIFHLDNPQQYFGILSFNKDFLRIPLMIKTLEDYRKTLIQISLIFLGQLWETGIEFDPRPIFDLFYIRNLENLEYLHLGGVTIHKDFLRCETDNLSINRIQYIPKNIRVIEIENVVLKIYSLNFLLRELKTLEELKLQKIGDSDEFGITPCWINELDKRRSIKVVTIIDGLNQTKWDPEQLQFDLGFEIDFEANYPLVYKVGQVNEETFEESDEQSGLELKLLLSGYEVLSI